MTNLGKKARKLICDFLGVEIIFRTWLSTIEKRTKNFLGLGKKPKLYFFQQTGFRCKDALFVHSMKKIRLGVLPPPTSCDDTLYGDDDVGAELELD